MSRIFQDLKVEIEINKKNANWKKSGNKNLGIGPRTTMASPTNKTQEMEHRISGIEDMIEKISTLVKENAV